MSFQSDCMDNELINPFCNWCVWLGTIVTIFRTKKDNYSHLEEKHIPYNADLRESQSIHRFDKKKYKNSTMVERITSRLRHYGILVHASPWTVLSMMKMHMLHDNELHLADETRFQTCCSLDEHVFWWNYISV